MALGNLGFWAQVAIAAASLISNKKGQEKAEREAEYAASIEAIKSGDAVAAPSVMTDEDIAILKRIWPRLREVSYLMLADWSKLGATGLSTTAKAALAPIWSTVRQAANFSDVSWNYHAVPIAQVAATLPVPELPDYMRPSGAVPMPLQAGFMTGIPQEYVLAGGIGLALLLVLSQRR